MKRKYNANNLYVGRIMYISNESNGPFSHKTSLKYIFEAQNIESRFYEEIFTRIRIQRESTTHDGNGFDHKDFNKPYIVNLESFLNYFPDEANQKIHAKSMLLRMNEINISNEKETQQDLVKTKIKNY